jgi:hypothetical protein
VSKTQATVAIRLQFGFSPGESRPRWLAAAFSAVRRVG